MQLAERLSAEVVRLLRGKPVVSGWLCPACHTDNELPTLWCPCGYAKDARPDIVPGLDRHRIRRRPRGLDLLLLALVSAAVWYLW